MIIGFSIQTNWRFYKENDWISFWRLNRKKIGKFNALEIVIPIEWENNFKLSIENYNWLSNLDYISYHLIDISKKTMNVIKQFPYITSFICHYDSRSMLNSEFLFNYGDHLLIENLENKQNKFNNEKICLDIAHVLADKENPNKYFKKYKKQIRQIHLSCPNEKIKHTPIYCSKYKLNKKIYNYPIILEGSFRNINEMKKELDYIREYYEK